MDMKTMEGIKTTAGHAEEKVKLKAGERGMAVCRFSDGELFHSDIPNLMLADHGKMAPKPPAKSKAKAKCKATAKIKAKAKASVDEGEEEAAEDAPEVINADAPAEMCEEGAATAKKSKQDH